MRTNIISALIVAIAFLSSCNGNYDTPEKEIPKFEGTATHTIQELKEQYIKTGTEFKSVDTIPDDVIITGEVIANDISGNIYKNIVIRDESAAINVSIDAYNLSNRYRLGQRVFIKCKGLHIGKYGSLPQIGTKGWNEKYQESEMSRIPAVLEKNYIFLDGAPTEMPVPVVMTINEIKNATSKPFSQLVTIKDVTFVEGGTNYFADPKIDGINASNPPDARVIKDASGATIKVSTSRFAKFARKKLPTGTGDLTVIVGFYRMTSGTSANDAWQLNLRDLGDLGAGFILE